MKTGIDKGQRFPDTVTVCKLNQAALHRDDNLHLHCFTVLRQHLSKLAQQMENQGEVI